MIAAVDTGYAIFQPFQVWVPCRIIFLLGICRRIRPVDGHNFGLLAVQGAFREEKEVFTGW